ncbi:MAG: hypothetical protein N3A38_16850, partial [Planctomycetota bacterium]|nr:hypothetical protein [Planctomycetota bacterium]
LTGTFDCPAKDNGIEGQRLQAVTVDCHVPADTAPGEYEGRLSVSSGDHRAILALKVRVYAATIPDDIHFNPELNCYSGPGRAGSEKFRESFRLAHYHRCTINRVPYSQGGKAHEDWAPKTDGRGRVTDWSRFDRDLGPLFDGSLFADNPRRGVPVPTIYLPLFEGWPLNFRDHYRPGEGVPVIAKTREDRLRHDTLARPIEEAFDDAFKEAFIACVRDFAAHFREKAWTRTIFQCYLNNKPGYGYTMWTLDEPNVWVDWAALNFFAGLLKRGVEDPDVYSPRWHEELFARGLSGLRRDRPTIVFRGDISRPMWQGSCSDGLMSMIYVGGVQFSMPRLVENLKLRAPAILYSYGACNDASRSNWETVAWCLKAYAAGSDGVLPWQSLGGADAMRKLNQEALIVDGGPALGQAIASFRVHALRRGAQDCELLRLLQLRRGWSRGH